jgi:hypothetical protein
VKRCLSDVAAAGSIGFDYRAPSCSWLISSIVIWSHAGSCRVITTSRLALERSSEFRFLKTVYDSKSCSLLKQPRLCDLLVGTWMTRATYARDMIYGLLSLSRESNLPEFSSEYTKRDADQLYTEGSRHFLNRNELLDALYVAGIGYPREVTPLPSWVPDWSCAPKGSPLRCLAAFRVSNGTTPNSTCFTESSFSKRSISGQDQRHTVGTVLRPHGRKIQELKDGHCNGGSFQE